MPIPKVSSARRPPSDGPSIARISPRGLAPANNLDHLPPPQPQIARDGIAGLDPRQLALLQAVAFEQLFLLLRAEQDVLGHELVVGDVDEEVLLLERFDDVGQHDGDDLQRGGRDAGLADENAGEEIVLGDVLGKGAHLLDPDGQLGGEFDPDGADLRRGRRVSRRGERGVFGQHGRRGAC